MKIDPYNNEKSYLDWKEKTKHGIAEISDYNATILLQYLNDMEIGINVGIGTKKGARSFIRLKSLKDKLIFLMKKVKILYNLDEITEISEKQIHILFSKMFQILQLLSMFYCQFLLFFLYSPIITKVLSVEPPSIITIS